MSTFTVACVQQRLHLHDDLDAYREELARYLRIARAKGTNLAVFPELAGFGVLSPMLQGRRAGLLRQAERARQPKASLWMRTKGKVAASAAGLLKLSLRQALAELLAEDAPGIWSAFRDLFSWAAREFGMSIVAGGGYVLDDTGATANQAIVFGPDGGVVGRQSKVDLAAADQGLCAPGSGWTTIECQAGRIGVLLGNDMLYPEAGRILAYQGAEVLVGLCAVAGDAEYRRYRAGLAARAEENQLYGVVSFLVGSNPLAGGERLSWAGQSAIFAPAELTPDRSGVLAQVGTAGSEAVITAQWDFDALHDLWRLSDTPLRRKMPMTAFAELATRYQNQQTLQDASQGMELEIMAPAARPAPLPTAEVAQASSEPDLLAVRQHGGKPEAPADATAASAGSVGGDETHREPGAAGSDSADLQDAIPPSWRPSDAVDAPESQSEGTGDWGEQP